MSWISPVLFSLAAVIGAPVLAAGDDDVIDDNGVSCVSPVAVLPPFNATPEALEQARIAAGYIVPNVCTESALMPAVSPMSKDSPATGEG